MKRISAKKPKSRSKNCRNKTTSKEDWSSKQNWRNINSCSTRKSWKPTAAKDGKFRSQLAFVTWCSSYSLCTSFSWHLSTRQATKTAWICEKPSLTKSWEAALRSTKQLSMNKLALTSVTILSLICSQKTEAQPAKTYLSVTAKKQRKKNHALSQTRSSTLVRALKELWRFLASKIDFYSQTTSSTKTRCSHGSKSPPIEPKRSNA